ncbi:MAG TPA: hypothetical protein VK510_03200 [Solirubrobacteraceae bacterium]|nr:hypothetical protein [Solirubrobacteraceae bacterium]
MNRVRLMPELAADGGNAWIVGSLGGDVGVLLLNIVTTPEEAANLVAWLLVLFPEIEKRANDIRQQILAREDS